MDVWWEEGDTLFYETDAGTVGLPRDQIVEIRTSGTAAPSYRGRADAETPARDDGPPESEAPPRPKPNLAELDALIETLRTERRRAGDGRAGDAIEARAADLHVLRARIRAKSGDVDRAALDYRTALELRPAHRIASYELGWLELSRGRTADAMDLAEDGLDANPGDPWLLELRGEALFRDNRLRDALEDFSRAAAGRPSEPAVRARLEKVRRDLAAEHDYDRALSRHFVLRFDGDRDEDLGAAVLDALEGAWDGLTDELEVHPIEPFTVILYSREQFAETTGHGREVAGLFDGKIRLPVGGLASVTPRVERVLRHELVHALLHRKGAGRVPRWLHEGLAQRLEPRDPDTVRPALVRATEALDLQPFSYPKSLSFVAFLDERHSRGRVLWLIELLARRTPEPDAFERAFGRTREALLEEWRRWLLSGR